MKAWNENPKPFIRTKPAEDILDSIARYPETNWRIRTVDERLNLQDFEKATGLALPRGSSDTIAGFVTEHLGRLAVVGNIIDVPRCNPTQVTALSTAVASLAYA